MKTALSIKHYSVQYKAANNRAAKECLEKRCEDRNVENKFQIQLLKDGGSSTRQNWMKTGGLWSVILTTTRVVNIAVLVLVPIVLLILFEY